MTTNQPSRQEQFSGVKEMDQRLALDAKRLEDYMAGAVDGFQGPLDVKQFRGGQSNPTYRLATPARSYVLRRKPPGKLLPSAHAVDREYRVISALHGAGFPVPRPYALCEDESIAGTIFYIMEMVEGRIIWEPLMPGVDATERTAIFDAMNDVIARLHSLDPHKIGLSEFGKPGNYFARQISRWSKQYLASETETIDAMNKLISWLPDNIPEGDDISVVHGDYRLDNMILHPTEPKVLAVLDWELSTLGHPLGDFTYHLVPWRMPLEASGGLSSGGLIDADLAKLGIPDEDAYVRAYCERTGRDHIEHLDFYMAYNFFRLAGILQGIVGRVRDGTAASVHAARSAASVRPLCEAAWMFARQAGAV